MSGAFDDNELCLSTRANGDGHVEVEIADTGPGIAPEVLDHMFEPFVTTKPQGVGTGLGLFVSARLVESMGAQIAVVRTDSTGTTVRVTVPVAAPAGS
jgi:signal transduction histidine kinase